jgi:hypothetical protein
MTSKKLIEICEKRGWGIAHARSYKRFGEIRAYVAVRNDSHPKVDMIVWKECQPTWLYLYHYATKANGYGQYDLFLTTLPISRKEIE